MFIVLYIHNCLIIKCLFVINTTSISCLHISNQTLQCFINDGNIIFANNDSL
jgi:hypothetical protein